MNDLDTLETLFTPNYYLYFNHDNYLTNQKTQTEISFLCKHLKINKYSSMLDLACGHGRHTNGMSKYLNNIIGIDINNDFLKIAQENQPANVKYIHQDIRDISYTDKFDTVILLNTVFGLFSDQDNYQLLIKINKSLKKSGTFCFDVINRDTLLIDFQNNDIVEKENKNFMLDQLSFDQYAGRAHVKRTYIKDTNMTHTKFSIRVYNYTEIETLLKQTGFKIIETFSGWDSSKIKTLSKKMVFLVEKE